VAGAGDAGEEGMSLQSIMHRRPPSPDPYVEDALEANEIREAWEANMELEPLAPLAPVPDSGVSEEDFYL